MASRDDVAVEVAVEPDQNLQDDTQDRIDASKRTTQTEHEDQTAEIFETQRPPTPQRRLVLMVLADFGLAFTWLSKFAVATPYFEHTLKAGPFLSHLVWIMGPLSGLIVAPLVGVLSDRCTLSYGRRRPFILGGMLACVFGMNVFANAKEIALGYLPAARWLAFLAFGVLDFSTNAIMFPSRALLGDLLPADEQHTVQGTAAVVASIAEICAGTYIWAWKDPVTHVSKVFMVASIILAVTCAVSLYVCREEPLRPENIIISDEDEIVAERLANAKEPDEEEGVRLNGPVEDIEKVRNSDSDPPSDDPTEDGHEAATEDADVDQNERDAEDDAEDDAEQQLSTSGPETSSQRNGGNEARPVERADVAGMTVWRELTVTLRTAILHFPRPLIRVGIVYGLAWFAWFASLPFYSQWLGVDVLGGDPHAAPGSKEAMQYQRGVSIFSVANVSKALIAIVFSAHYPRIVKFVGNIGERVVFSVSFLVFAMVLYSSAYTKNVAVAVGVIALGSVPFIVTQTIPIAIAVQRFPEHLASNLGVLNLFCVIPQLIDTIYTGKVAEIAGESAVLRVASIWAFAAGFAALLFL